MSLSAGTRLGAYEITGLNGQRDLSRDGQRIAITSTPEVLRPTTGEHTATVVLGFGDEVRRRLAASK